MASKYSLVCVFSMFLFSHLYAGFQWDEKQVCGYVHDSEWQRRSSWHLLSQIRFKGDEKVLDMGCGDGRNTAWIANLVPQGQIIGMDPSEAMIHWAKRQYHPFEFPNLSFYIGDDRCLPSQVFDVITSFFSLHMIENKELAVQMFFDRLSEEGRLFAVIPSDGKNKEFSTAMKETMNSPIWHPYFENFQSVFKWEEFEAYINYFKEGGFSIVRAEYVPSVDPFVNREEAIHWFLGTWSNIHYLPEELHERFFHDVIDSYLEKRPDACSTDGVICFYWGYYELIAQKSK